MAKITSIGTALPQYQYAQLDIFESIKKLHASTPDEERILRFLYNNSGISTRYSVLPDFNVHRNSEFLDENIFFSVDKRLDIYNKNALKLSVQAIQNCLKDSSAIQTVTHLITISCTGMSAPGLDLQLVEHLNLAKNITRSSINFMGCYAAIHGLKMANDIVNSNPNAKVLVVDIELCTLHFQKEKNNHNIISTIVFGDGAAAILVEPTRSENKGWHMHGFYSEVKFEGKQEMAWDISASGFLMTLTNEVPKLLEQHSNEIIIRALQHYNTSYAAIDYWCIHPGGKKIIEAIEKAMKIEKNKIQYSYDILQQYGNMSSPTILFVLDLITKKNTSGNAFLAAFGPGLTLETALLEYA